MHMQDLIGGIEAILFASANPMTEADLKKVVARWVMSLPPETDDAADAAASPLQLEASLDEPQNGAAQDTEAETAENQADADQVSVADATALDALQPSEQPTPQPDPQADGALSEPVHIPDAELQAAGSEAAGDAEVPPAPSPDEHVGRLTLDKPLPQVVAASDGADTAIDAEAAEAEAEAEGAKADDVDDEAAAPKAHVHASDGASEAKPKAQHDTDVVAAPVGAGEVAQTAASDEVQAADDATLAPEPVAAVSAQQTRFDWRKHFKAAIAAVKNRWQDPPEHCGFTLVEVADALTFRSNPRFAPVLLAMRDDKPPKLSRAAMETLAIIAYRQPVTKPESDHIRGVDCGGTIKMLLDRNLIRIVGKKEEPGRPLLYGTGPEFLSFFNLASVHNLPSLRAFDELNDDSEDALRELDALPSLQELSAQAKQFRLDDEPAMGSLDAAVDALRRTESTSRDALAEQGITLAGDDDDKPRAASAPAPTQH
jgi:segregation and condensation protein B